MKHRQAFLHGHYSYHPGQNSEFVKWSDSLSIGIKMIDDQHMEILSFVNELLCSEMISSAAESDEERQAYFKEIIGRTVNYIKNHFATEERMMLASRFPHYEEHKQEHNSFTLNVIKSAKDFEAGKRLALTNFSNYLKDWVLAHIAIMDIQYIEYFKGNLGGFIQCPHCRSILTQRIHMGY